jgi:hypothetical protein
MRNFFWKYISLDGSKVPRKICFEVLGSEEKKEVHNFIGKNYGFWDGLFFSTLQGVPLDSMTYL